MGKRCYVSIAIPGLVIDKANEKISYFEIAHMLRLSNSTVDYTMKKYGKFVNDLGTSIAPRKTTLREDNLIRRKSIANQKKDLVEICSHQIEMLSH